MLASSARLGTMRVPIPDLSLPLLSRSLPLDALEDRQCHSHVDRLHQHVLTAQRHPFPASSRSRPTGLVGGRAWGPIHHRGLAPRPGGGPNLRCGRDVSGRGRGRLLHFHSALNRGALVVSMFLVRLIWSWQFAPITARGFQGAKLQRLSRRWLQVTRPP